MRRSTSCVNQTDHQMFSQLHIPVYLSQSSVRSVSWQSQVHITAEADPCPGPSPDPVRPEVWLLFTCGVDLLQEGEMFFMVFRQNQQHPERQSDSSSAVKHIHHPGRRWDRRCPSSVVSHCSFRAHCALLPSPGLHQLLHDPGPSPCSFHFKQIYVTFV